MEEEILAYYLDKDEVFQEIPSEVYAKLMKENNSNVMPELGGNVIQLAVIHLLRRDKKPNKVTAIDFRRCKLMQNGSLDPNFKERRKKMCVELASIQLQEHQASNVLDASRRFKERRFHNEFAWTPTVSMVQKLSAFIQQKTQGALESREIMYQILHLTATA